MTFETGFAEESERGKQEIFLSSFLILQRVDIRDIDSL